MEWTSCCAVDALLMCLDLALALPEEGHTLFSIGRIVSFSSDPMKTGKIS